MSRGNFRVGLRCSSTGDQPADRFCHLLRPVLLEEMTRTRDQHWTACTGNQLDECFRDRGRQHGVLSAPVVDDERRPAEVEFLDEPRDGCDVAVVRVPADLFGLVRTSEPDQVGRDDAAGQRGDDLSPEEGPRRLAVQEQHRIALAFVDVVHAQAVDVEPVRLEGIVGKGAQVGPVSRARRTASPAPSVHGSPWPKSSTPASRLSIFDSESMIVAFERLNAVGISCGPRAPVSGLRVQSRSPATSTPRDSSQKQAWPAVWPGVCIARGRPGTSTSSPSPNVVTSCTCFGKPDETRCASSFHACPYRRYGKSEPSLPLGGFPVVVRRSSSRCTSTGTLSSVRTGSAKPMWSACPCVSRTAATSAGRRPRSARPRSSCGRYLGAPASTIVTRPSSSTRYQLTSSVPSRTTPSATSVGSVSFANMQGP